MNPRLKTSTKWTSFPKEYMDQILTVFKGHFEAPEAAWIVEGRIYPEELLLRVGVRFQGELSQANFELSAPYSTKQDNVVERIYDCIDAAASLMTEYFETKSAETFPRTWTEFEFNKKSLFFQYSSVNTELEAEADRLLGLSQDQGLVQESLEDEDDENPNPKKVH